MDIAEEQNAMRTRILQLKDKIRFSWSIEPKNAISDGFPAGWQNIGVEPSGVPQYSSSQMMGISISKLNSTQMSPRPDTI
jgi:hypothetical protein